MRVLLGGIKVLEWRLTGQLMEFGYRLLNHYIEGKRFVGIQNNNKITVVSDDGGSGGLVDEQRRELSRSSEIHDNTTCCQLQSHLFQNF